MTFRATGVEGMIDGRSLDPQSDEWGNRAMSPPANGAASADGVHTILGAAATEAALSSIGPAVTGQLYFFGQGNPTDARLSYVNNDGSSQTVIVDNNPTTDLITSFPQELGVDTAAGFYFALVNGGSDGSGARLVRGSLAGGAATELVDYRNDLADSSDDTIVNALQVDVINHKIYVGVQDPSGGSPGNTGIQQYSYDPLTGAITDLGFLVTVTSSGKPQESGADVFDVRDFALDSSTHLLAFTELLTGGVSANGLFTLDINSPNSVHQLVPQSQFPDDGSAGFITDVEIDNSNSLVYFDVESRHPYSSLDPSNPDYAPAQNAIYYISETADGTANATQLTLTGLPAGGHFYPGDMVLDQETNQLYVESEENDSGSGADTDDVIYVFQLSADGHSGSLINTVSMSPPFINLAANIGGMIFNDIPALTGVSGTATHAAEQGSAITLLTAAPTITDLDGDHLSSATVKITGGLFSTNESNATDDHLSVLAAALSGTNITATYDSATLTLTLSGYDTLAHYQQALAGVQYSTTGDNPTDYGLETTRTFTWTVSDGALNIPDGSQNSATTSITIDAVNDAPVNTVPGAQTVDEDSTLAITGVSVSDSDANPALAQVSVTLQVDHGTIDLRTDVALGLTAGEVSGNDSGTVTVTGTINEINTTLGALNGLTYTNSPADYHGSDTLTVTVNDGGATGSDPGFTGGAGDEQDVDTVGITINPVADIVDDSPTTNEDTAMNVLVQANDTFENPAHSITAFDQGAHGSVALNDNGTALDTTDDYLVYTPDADFNGSDSFTYTITSAGLTETATVNVTISPVADIADDSITVLEDSGTSDIDVFGNDGFDTSNYAITAITQGTIGTVAIDTHGTADTTDDTITYTPNANANGADSFTYTVTSGGVTETATVNVGVTAVDDPSVGENDAFVIDEATAIVGGDLFADNGSGPDSDVDSPLSISEVNGNPAAVGTQITLASGALLTVNSDGTFDYDPNGAFQEVPVPASGGYNTPGIDSFTYTLASGGEVVTATITIGGLDNNDRVLGTSANDTLLGGLGNDIIRGFGGDDSLDGGTGADLMNGGAGDDSFIVDNSGDIVREVAGEGTDTVSASVTYSIGLGYLDYIENLTLTGSSSINGTGNFLANTIEGNDAANVLDGRTGDDVLYGNGGNDTLNGGKGADSMTGGLGDDTYIVDNSADQVIEAAGGGFDVVRASATFSLVGQDVERLVLTGSGNIDGTGNALDNVMSGNGGNNVLDGGTGADVMNGGAGDDSFIVDNSGDIVREAAGEGTDTVSASVSYSLGLGYLNYIENLTLTGSSSINGTGNFLDNTIQGNDAQNVLNGRTGDDVLDGKIGNDILVGGDGADTFVFDSAFGVHNVDRIADFVSGTDHFQLSSTVFTALPGSSTLDTSAFYAGTTAHDADDHIIYDTTTGNLYYDADGDGAAAQILFAHITPGSALSNGDFNIG